MNRAYYWFGVLCLLAVVFTALPVSRLAIVPHSVEIVGDQVSLERSFPGDMFGLPRPFLSYVETVTPLTQGHNGGHPCQVKGGPFRYARAENIGTWSIDWAAACLSDPSGFIWSAAWTWHVGALRLGPVRLERRFWRSPCQYRVSSTGRVHGTDNPHWSQTSDTHCFSTRAEAEAFASDYGTHSEAEANR